MEKEAVHALPDCLAVFGIKNGIDDAVLAGTRFCTAIWDSTSLKIFFGFHSVFGIKRSFITLK